MTTRALITVALAATIAANAAAGGAVTRSGEAPPPLASQRADAEPLAIVGADVHPVTSPVVPGGTILLRGGRIQAILPAGSRRARAAALESRGYRVVDGTGLHVHPGLVAAGADSLGLAWDGAVVGRRDALKLPVVDSFDVRDDAVELAASAGITSALVYRTVARPPGPFNGRGAVLKMSYGEPRGVVLRAPAAVFAASSALTASNRFQVSRLLEEAREWRRNTPRERRDDPEKELLAELATGRIPLVITASSVGNVLAAADLAEDEGLRLVVYHPMEAWSVADRLAGVDAWVVQHVRGTWFKARDSRRTVIEGGWRFDAPARLTAAGVDVCVLPLTDVILTWGVAGRDLLNLPLEAAFAQRGGLSAEHALEAVTIAPARMLGVADRIGSLEAGKDADVILTDGDVLDYRTHVRMTIVNGRVVYEAEGNRHWGWVAERRARQLATGDDQPLPDVGTERGRDPS